MTAPEHARMADQILEVATESGATVGVRDAVEAAELQAMIAVAQVHATLAVAAALQAGEDRINRWRVEDLERMDAWRAEEIARDDEVLERQLANSRAVNEHAIQLQDEAEQRRHDAWTAELGKAADR